MRLAVLLFLLTGTQHVEVVVSRPCLTDIKITDHAECTGPDLKHMTCTGLLITYRKGCEVLKVVRDN